MALIKPKISVCLSPSLIHLFDIQNAIVVVTDVLRATTAMIVGLDAGLDHIVPVLTVEESKSLQDQGYIVAAERNGLIADGFEYGNSPVKLLKANLLNQKLAITTTNGTKAIKLANDAHKLILGAFVNISALAEYLKKEQKDVVILCAGWKDDVNLEDSLFAGAVVYHLMPKFSVGNDAAFMSSRLYDTAKDDLFLYIQNSSHYNRLNKMGIEDDIRFCMKEDQSRMIPILKEDKIYPFKG